MIEEINNHPTTPEQIAAQMEAVRPPIGIEELKPYLLDPSQDYPEPYYLLEFNGVPFSTFGGLQAMSGQKKNGKSFVFTMLMAAILGGDPTKTRVPVYLPGLRVPERTIEYLGHEPRVLYVDTEMEKLNSAKVLRRVHWLCGWDMRVPNERFHVLWLKTMPKDDGVPAYKNRFRLIELAVELLKPDVVFIDGLRDLLASINDEETATQILDSLSTMAEERKMCIWNALHQNPKANSDGEDTKMRGWAGTELGNKVSDTFVSIKSKSAAGVTFTVKQVDARGKDVPDWKFEVTDDAGHLGIPKLICNGSGISVDNAPNIYKEADEYFKTFDFPKNGTTYTALEKHLRAHGLTSNRKIQSIFEAGRESGIIYQNESKKYFYKGLEKPIINDEVKDIQFDGSSQEDCPF